MKAVEPGNTMSEYARNVVALGEMEHQTDELFEPAGRVFGSRGMSLEPQLQGILSEWDVPVELPPYSCFLILDSRLRGNDKSKDISLRSI